MGAILKVQTNTPKDVLVALEQSLPEFGTPTINNVGPTDAVKPR